MTLLQFPPTGDSTMANFGGVNAIAYDPETGVFTGVADPRRYGSAQGPRAVSEIDSSR